jgi:hypothetical protein
MHGIYRKRDLNESSQSSHEDINRSWSATPTGGR